MEGVGAGGDSVTVAARSGEAITGSAKATRMSAKQ
jgi:hypothetical protein